MQTDQLTINFMHDFLIIKGHTDEMRTSRILGMFERRKWRKALQSATSSKKKQKDAETVHQVDYVSSGGKETMLTTDQQSNVVTGDVLSKPMPSSSAKKKWNKFMSKKKDHPTRSGIIIEREHVYDIYREDNEDFDDVLWY